MAEREKISVIVPIYNVEAYLVKCIESLIAQTYDNLEIILVDDGSPDGCSAICDEYAAKDGRIIVIHKENGGVFTARNAGLDIASGDWIGFVDPDDWVDADMYEYLISGAVKYGSEVAACGAREIWDRGTTVMSCGDEKFIGSPVTELPLINKNLMTCCWNKISRRALWDSLRFPPLSIAQDVWVTEALCAAMKNAVCLPEPKYNYIHRETSTVMGRELKKRIAHFDAARRWYDHVAVCESERTGRAGDFCVSCAKSIWSVYSSAPASERREYREKMREISDFCRPLIADTLERDCVGRMGSIAIKSVAYPNSLSYAVAGLASRLYASKSGKPL